MSDRYCVFGHPIGHSKSPQIHAAFAAQSADTMEYTAIEAPRDDFAGAWRDFVAAGGRGANVTVPFKEEAFRLCEVLSSPRPARRSGEYPGAWQGWPHLRRHHRRRRPGARPQASRRHGLPERGCWCWAPAARCAA